MRYFKIYEISEDEFIDQAKLNISDIYPSIFIEHDGVLLFAIDDNCAEIIEAQLDAYDSDE